MPQEERKSAGNSEEQASDSTIRSQSTDDTETSYILVEDSDGSQKALSVTEISPEIGGWWWSAARAAMRSFNRILSMRLRPRCKFHPHGYVW